MKVGDLIKLRETTYRSDMSHDDYGLIVDSYTYDSKADITFSLYPYKPRKVKYFTILVKGEIISYPVEYIREVFLPVMSSNT